MAYRNLTLSRDDPIITITIECPPANALDSATLLELGDALDAIEADDALRAVVLTGAGRKCFVAGADIAEVVNCVFRAKTNSRFGVSRTAISAEGVHRFRRKPNSRFG